MPTPHFAYMWQISRDGNSHFAYTRQIPRDGNSHFAYIWQVITGKSHFGVHFPQFNALYQRGTKSPRNVTHLDEAGDVLLGYFNTIIYYATSEKLPWVRLFNLKNLYQQAVGNSSNTWNPAGDLRGPHPARLHPSRAIRHPSLTGT